MIESVSFSNFNNLSLSGILNNGRDYSPVIVLVHGFAGNKDENGLFSLAESYFASKNMNTFRFDFEGVGESKGDYINSSLENQVNDLKSALYYVSSKYNHGNIYVVGFSLGATVSILANDSRVKAYALWSPALFPKNDMFPRYDTPEIKKELAEKGFIEKAGIKVGKNIIDDLGKYSLENCMNAINKPVLLIHGTLDPRINYKSTIKGKDYFLNAKLELIDGANHSYKNNFLHREQVFEKTAEFFEKIN